MYRFRVTGEENIPTTGAAILVCNHVSLVDAVLLLAASPRPICFVMDHRIFRVPVLGALFRLARAIPIAPRSQDPVVYEAAIVAAQKVLQEGDLLAIFPEGGITTDGRLQAFKGGVLRILERQAVPVIPMALTNMWGSFFSRGDNGKPMSQPFRRGALSRVGLNIGAPLAPKHADLELMRSRVEGLLEPA